MKPSRRRVGALPFPPSTNDEGEAVQPDRLPCFHINVAEPGASPLPRRSVTLKLAPTPFGQAKMQKRCPLRSAGGENAPLCGSVRSLGY